MLTLNVINDSTLKRIEQLERLIQQTASVTELDELFTAFQRTTDGLNECVLKMANGMDQHEEVFATIHTRLQTALQNQQTLSARQNVLRTHQVNIALSLVARFNELYQFLGVKRIPCAINEGKSRLIAALPAPQPAKKRPTSRRKRR